MSLSVINNKFCKLKRVRPLIVTNDSKIYKKYLKEKLINNQNKKIFSLKASSSNYINIKALMTPNLEKKNVYDYSNINSLKQIKTDESKEGHNYKNILTENENKSTNFASIKNSKNLDLPILKNNFLKNSKIPNLNSLLLNSKKSLRNDILKINKSTNVSNEKYKFNNNINNTEMNNINKVRPEKNEKSSIKNNNNDLQSSSPSLIDNQSFLEKNKFPFKQFFMSKANFNKRRNQKMNFIINVKSIDSRIVKQKILDTLFHKTISKSRKKDLNKKDESMESLDDNSIWNDYTKIEKDKSKAIERNKLNMKEKVNNLVKLFKNSYSYKKYKKKGIKNQKEQYLNFLDDYSLSLRANFIKNNLLNDRGGKHNLRVTYNPLMK